MSRAWRWGRRTAAETHSGRTWAAAASGPPLPSRPAHAGVSQAESEFPTPSRTAPRSATKRLLGALRAAGRLCSRPRPAVTPPLVSDTPLKAGAAGNCSSKHVPRARTPGRRARWLSSYVLASISLSVSRGARSGRLQALLESMVYVRATRSANVLVKCPKECLSYSCANSCV